MTHQNEQASVTPLLEPTSPAPGYIGLPGPETFNFLAPLHELLSRVLVPTPNSLDAHLTLLPGYSNQQSLSIQYLGAEVASIRNKIRTARSAIGNLYGVEKGLLDQQATIQQLEEQVTLQRSLLEHIAGE